MQVSWLGRLRSACLPTAYLFWFSRSDMLGDTLPLQWRDRAGLTPASLLASTSVPEHETFIYSTDRHCSTKFHRRKGGAKKKDCDKHRSPKLQLNTSVSVADLSRHPRFSVSPSRLRSKKTLTALQSLQPGCRICSPAAGCGLHLPVQRPLPSLV